MNPQEAKKKYIEILRSFDGNRRVKIGAELYEIGLHIVEASIRNQNPKIPEEELKEKIRQRIK